MYPITINEDDISKRVPSRTPLSGILDGASMSVVGFVELVHELIYDYFIYSMGAKLWRARVIAQHKEWLEHDIKRCLLAQAQYMLANEASLHEWSGLVQNASGGVDVVGAQEIYGRLISPQAQQMLLNLSVPVMYAGGA